VCEVGVRRVAHSNGDNAAEMNKLTADALGRRPRRWRACSIKTAPQRFATVRGAKVRVDWNLHEAKCRGRTLDFFVAVFLGGGRC